MKKLLDKQVKLINENFELHTDLYDPSWEMQAYLRIDVDRPRIKVRHSKTVDTDTVMCHVSRMLPIDLAVSIFLVMEVFKYIIII